MFATLGVMNLIEMAVSLLAPHTCSNCKREGMPVCARCAKRHFTPPAPCCYRCAAPSEQFATCQPCLGRPGLQHVWAATGYTGAAKETVALLKFQRAKAAAYVIADCLDRRLPALPAGVIVSAVPTASSRVRLRGYDQARLIAHRLAKKRGLMYQDTLWRVKTTRQVGANRSDRFHYLENAFVVRKPKRLIGQHVLLVDDVLTTGATLESAARELNRCGTGRIDAAVFARQDLKPGSSSSTRNAQGSAR